eukprot:3955944-Pleurochrysis_carterae.AAC.2
MNVVSAAAVDHGGNVLGVWRQASQVDRRGIRPCWRKRCGLRVRRLNGRRHGVSVGAAPVGASRPRSVNGEAGEEGPWRVGQKLLGACQGQRGDEGTEGGLTVRNGA